MELIHTKIEGLLIIRPKVMEDERGYFFESFREDEFAGFGINCKFVQDNESCSGKNVLRGLHFQRPPFVQAKLVRVVAGAVLDVAVDLRKASPTFGQWEAIMLTQQNKVLMFIPEGFAHGFLTLEDRTVFQYKCSDYYNRESEGAIAWNDPDLGIHWKAENPVVSSKDMSAPWFRHLDNPF